MSHNFRNLVIWKKSRAYVKKIYRVTQTFPKSEQFNLISQLQRSATSIPSNISEGCNLMTDKQLIKHLYIAMGSAGELETQLEVSTDLGFLPMVEKDELVKEVIELQKMIMGFIKKIQSK